MKHKVCKEMEVKVLDIFFEKKCPGVKGQASQKIRYFSYYAIYLFQIGFVVEVGIVTFFRKKNIIFLPLDRMENELLFWIYHRYACVML